MQLDEVSFLAWIELRRLPAQPALALGDLHSFPRPGTDEVGFELGNHRQHVEQQLAHRVGGVVHRPGDAQLDLPGREVVGDLVGIADGPSQPIELGDHEGVTIPTRCQRLAQTVTVGVAAREPVIDVDPLGLDTKGSETIALRGEVLLVGGDSGIADLQRGHAHQCVTYGPVTGQFTGRVLSLIHISEPTRRS